MRILAIETSCDETAVCVLEARGGLKNPRLKILSNIVASQVKIHAPWGGVVPNLAKREHQKNLPIILKKVFKQAKLSLQKPKIDIIAVTNGPGLEPALWVGINFAQDLAKKWKKPLIGINHLEGHIFSVFLKSGKKSFRFHVSGSKLFPALALVVSGGHTELVLMEKFLKYRVIGQTLDDAVGEAFDKVARLLGLGYPGGPVIAKFASNYTLPVTRYALHLPRPMINSKDYNFSFSGLKTAVLYLLRDLKQKSNYSLLVTRYGLLQSICAEFQQAAIDVLIKKTIRAAKEYKAKTIILGGGVAANKELRKQILATTATRSVLPTGRTDLVVNMPEMEFTGDNAAMIAISAYFRAFKNKKIGDRQKIIADSNLRLK